MALIASTASRLTLRLPSTYPKSLLHILAPRYRFFSTTPTAQDKRYTVDHEWIDLPHGTTVGTLGITGYAAQALGDVVYVELPTLSESVSAGDIVGAVESVKSASDIKTPLAGTIIEVNSLLEEKSSIMSAKPEQSGKEGGWIVKIEVDEKGIAEWKGLMNENEYKAFIDE